MIKVGVQLIAFAVAVSGVACFAHPAGSSREEAWADVTLAPDVRARALARAMTLDEKITLVQTHVGTAFGKAARPGSAHGSAGFGSGIPRLGIPPIQETDAGLGIANPEHDPALYDVTAMPSDLALGATFDPALARSDGMVLGTEARAKGFNTLLAGGANLVRDPRNGRNFEYIGEDPLLTGRMVGEVVAGIQSQGVVSTLKHFALNDQETGRILLSADIGEAAARESDLLAFQTAIEVGHPGAIMTAYNRVNGTYASENASLLAILKNDWHYQGWVMSDWGAVHSTAKAALAGLDQQSGAEFDAQSYFGRPLKDAVVAGAVGSARLDDMVTRILRANFAVGTFDHAAARMTPIPAETDKAVARRIAENGIVLLKNDGNILPLRTGLRRIAVIGAHADRGVLSGGGSSQVLTDGIEPFTEEQPPKIVMGIKYYHPSPPADAIRRSAPRADVVFVEGRDHEAAARAARGADVAIVFAEQWLGETHDASDLSLPDGQDDLIAKTAAANPRTVVVLETGGAVKMPWLEAVPAVMEAWYPGIEGADAIAAILFGTAVPSGRLPLTFPQAESQLPRPTLPDPRSTEANPGGPGKGAFSVDYNVEGADVGYRWFARRGLKPLFPFGYGLTYTRFVYDGLNARVSGDKVTASVVIRNAGTRAATETPQFYLDDPAGRFARRLVGWSRITLGPAEARQVEITVDPRLLATYDTSRHCWTIAQGTYVISARPSASAAGPQQMVRLEAHAERP